jgi:hypothetical protein
MNTNIKKLKDGEFGVSEDAETVKYDGQEEVEVFSTWVKAQWTRVSLPASDAKLSKINDLGFYQHIDVTSSGVGGKDLTVRNDFADETLEILLSWDLISKHLYEYCVENQVDEIIFTYTSQN